MANTPNVFLRLSRLRDYVEGDSSKERKELFDRVSELVLSGSYTKYKDFDILSRWHHLPDKDLAVKLGVKESSVRQIKKRVTSDFIALVGAEIFDTIQFGDAKALRLAIYELSLLSNHESSVDLFPSEILSAIEDGKTMDEDFNVGDCKYELTFLHWFNNNKIKSLLTNVDINRLAYLIEVLDGKRGTQQDRINVLKVLSADDLVKHSRPEDRSKFAFPPVRPDEDF